MGGTADRLMTIPVMETLATFLGCAMSRLVRGKTGTLEAKSRDKEPLEGESGMDFVAEWVSFASCRGLPIVCKMR